VKPIDSADRVIWVSLPRATFGIIVRDGRVVDGAPYARGRGLRLVGMNERKAVEKLRRLGAKLKPLPQGRIDT
jgi:hypothetical protein